MDYYNTKRKWEGKTSL